jgi:hypothetical protein
VVRKSGILLLLLALVFASRCRPPTEARFGADTRRLLDDGHRSASAWVALARTRVDVDATTAIAAGYLERLRLGLGSPFRLIEQAIDDPRLADSTRSRLAWALLSRTISRETYRIDPAALDPLGLRGSMNRPGGGRYHLDLIDGAIRQATDPRAGELAVRIAYALAAAQGAVPPTAPDLAARAAALIRDREMARTDALHLLRDAREQGTDPLQLLVRMRVDRAFEVERPASTPLSPVSEEHALDIAPRLARVVADLGSRTLPAALPEGQRGASLGRPAALRLIHEADSLDSPPIAPIVVPVRMHRDMLLERPWIDDLEREARETFIEQATNEERFVAGLVLLRRSSPYDYAPATVALTTAIAMRSLAQEPVWYPGFGGPSARELQERYGLADITFGDDVKPAWRPYYRWMLDDALRDLRRVLPSIRLDGLRVAFTDRDRPVSTLALHDPKTRRLVLPPGTAAGTIAHEIAHDIDWQVALRRYRVRGDYATDRATRLGRDRLADRVLDLAGSLRAGDDRSAHARRPAEVFARNVDWFVVVSLAAQGRSNGYLSSVQDELLTGYGTVRPPDISGVAGQALISILDEIAPVYPETRNAFEKRYGAAHALTPWDLTRRVLQIDGSDGSGERGPDTDALTWVGREFRAVEAARDAALAAIDVWVCSQPGASFNRDQETARRMLVAEAARARARGLALRIAREMGGHEGLLWMTQRLDGEPGARAAAADSTFRARFESIAELSERAGSVVSLDPSPRIDLQAPSARCAAAPFRVADGH